MMVAPEKVVRSTCPYCGVGCQMDLHLRDDLIYRVEAPFDSAPNYGNLCVKGRFGLDFATHPRRLTKPLIRDGGPGEFREAGWDEALTLVSERLGAIVTESGGDSIATYACAKATNEDNYVFQKWVRAVLGTNNVDHCARLCHAGSVTGLQLAIGSSAMSNSIGEMEDLDTFIVTGSNTTETHPVISLFLKKAVRQNGAKLIVIDPRQIELTDFATLWLRQEPGTDVAVFQAMAHVVVTERLYDADFIARRTEDFDDYVESLERFTPEWAEGVSGVPAEDIRAAARMYANAERAAFYWGMGISQSTHGTDNALSLTNLALMTGHVGKPGTGLNPLRGQNNVQGCSDSGGLPTVYTAYQRVDDPRIRGRFERAWDVTLPPKPGLTVTEMVDGALTGQIRAMVVMGENPLMSEPNLSHAQHAIEALDFVVCIDIFMNETGELADVILPSASFAEKDGTFTNSDRRVQRVRVALPPVGESRADWEIVCDLAQRMQRLQGRAIEGLPLRASRGNLGGNARADAGLRRHHLGAVGARGRRPLALPRRRSSRHALPLRGRVSARSGQVLAAGIWHGERTAGRGVPLQSDDRARALPLARRHHDPQLAPGGGLPGAADRDAPGRRAEAGAGLRRLGGGDLAPRQRDLPRAGDRALAGRDGLSALPLRGGGGQPADAGQGGPAREDPGLQDGGRAH